MPDFSDFFCPEEEIHNLKIELEELKNKFDELETAYLYTQNERVQMVFAIREMKIHRDEYRAALEKEAWELIEKEADKKFVEWVKKYHDIDQVKIEATLQP
jgi:16S rRNA C967 or C1407 C5-methylase (RsmB/RsmF family)